MLISPQLPSSPTSILQEIQAPVIKNRSEKHIEKKYDTAI
jgi:hypothetical protein